MSFRASSISAWESCPALIASGTSLSSMIDLGGLRLFGIAVPSAWTSASLTFQMSPDAGTSWFELLDQTGAAVTAAAAASGCLMLDPKQFAPLQYVRVRSGLAGSPVSQGADRTLQLVLRAV